MPIHGSRHLARCARRRGRSPGARWAWRVPVGGCSAWLRELSQNGSRGPRPAFFYLLWCCSHHPVLIGRRGTSGRRVRGKNLQFSSFLRRPWLFKVLCESALIPGLENRSDLFIFRADWEETQWPAGGAWGTPRGPGLWDRPLRCAWGLLIGELSFPKGRLHGNTASTGPPAILALFSQDVFVANKRNP